MLAERGVLGVYVLANGRIVHEGRADELDPEDPSLREHVAV